MTKKLLALALALILVLGLAACGGDASSSASSGSQSAAPSSQSEADSSSEAGGSTQTPQDFPTFKIGVIESQANDETVIRRAYYENYIAPTYNVEFIFSEQVSDIEDEMNFVETCVDMGVSAIISYSSSFDVPQTVRVCNEYGLPYTVNTTRVPMTEDAFTGGFEVFQGTFGTEPPDVAVLYKEWLEKNASADGSEGFMVTSALAFRGNTMHAECTIGVLAALQEMYDLTYEDTLENLAATAAPLEVPNDKGLNIYIYPGVVSTNEGWVDGASAALQTGKYGIMCQAAAQFHYTAVAVDEVERGFDFDIKVAAQGSISETLSTAFHTQDKFGNPSLNMAIIRSISFQSGLGFIQVYNALTGHEDLNRSNGEAVSISFPMWAINGPDQVDVVSSWDTVSDGLWVFDETVINDALGIYNPDLTYGDLQSYYNTITYDWAEAHMSAK